MARAGQAGGVRQKQGAAAMACGGRHTMHLQETHKPWHALFAPGMSMSAAAALQKPAVLTTLRPAATLQRPLLISQSPAQPADRVVQSHSHLVRLGSETPCRPVAVPPCTRSWGPCCRLTTGDTAQNPRTKRYIVCSKLLAQRKDRQKKMFRQRKRHSPPALEAANMSRYGSALAAPMAARLACSTCSRMYGAEGSATT